MVGISWSPFVYTSFLNPGKDRLGYLYSKDKHRSLVKISVKGVDQAFKKGESADHGNLSKRFLTVVN